MFLSQDNNHHAILLIGELPLTKEALWQWFESLSIRTQGNPDFFHFVDEVFGIDEARTLSERAQRKAFGERKIFVLSPGRITLEAQNALLKTFEDPFPDTRFFLVVREEGTILPTLRSRMHRVRMSVGETTLETAEKFLAMTEKKRIAFAKKFTDEKVNLSEFLDALVGALKADNTSAYKMRKVLVLRQFADDKAASPRLVIEHLALVLP